MRIKRGIALVSVLIMVMALYASSRGGGPEQRQLCTGGRVLARDVETCDFTLSQQLLELNLVLEKKRYGHEAPERVEIPVVMYFRN